MVISDINVKEFKQMVRAGQAILESKVDYVNSLNVFPVPDGDTGTNMNLTFTSGYKAISHSQAETIGELGNEFSKGLLMGARGNSGVILNQLFRGFCQQIKDEETINAQSLAEAFENGAKLAYQTMMKPREGTILTVAREAAEAGTEKAQETDDVIEVMETVFEASKVSLKNTPELLPILKEVGVVDSGGQGLVYIYQGFLSVLKGEEINLRSVDEEMVENVDISELAHQHEYFSSEAMTTEDIEFGYCTEIMVRLGDGETVEEEFDYDTFRNSLSELGDSLIVVSDDEIAKVHIHTEQPGEVMNYGQKFGSLMRIKVDNMREQHQDLKVKQGMEAQPKKANGVIAVASGEGMIDLFKSFGVDYIIEGGQTMNPSTQDFLNAIEKVNAEKVILLPNNSNIFLAAEQAAENSEVPAAVVPTKNISQGLTAMLGFDPQAKLEDNQEAMGEEMTYVMNGQVTYAVRDTKLDDLTIEKDDYMGLVNGDVVLSHKKKSRAAKLTIEEMLSEDSELLTIIFGEDVSQEEADALAEYVSEKYRDIEIEIYDGGQPVYSYTFSVE